MEIGKILVEEFKKEGIELLEENAMKAIEIVFNVAEKVIVESENKLDDVALPFLPKVESLLKGYADKINKQDNAQE